MADALISAKSMVQPHNQERSESTSSGDIGEEGSMERGGNRIHVNETRTIVKEKFQGVFKTLVATLQRQAINQHKVHTQPHNH